MTTKDRAKLRRQRIVTGRSHSYEEAEMWDLRYWQSLSCEQRLDAYMAIRIDVEKANAARKKNSTASETILVK